MGVIGSNGCMPMITTPLSAHDFIICGAESATFRRDIASSHGHQTCTAKMGRDPMSVVDACDMIRKENEL